MAFYSDNGVDGFIKGLLPEVGCAVDVGANDGKSSSNTLHFEENGWKVLCIEPNPMHAESGRKLRKIWRQVAASDKGGFGDYHCLFPYPHGSYSGLNPDKEHLERGEIIFEVGIFTLDTLLIDAGFTSLDLVSADVEGWEDQVMAGLSVELWKPKIIVLEHWDEGHAGVPGYDHINRLGYDDIYQRKS